MARHQVDLDAAKKRLLDLFPDPPSKVTSAEHGLLGAAEGGAAAVVTFARKHPVISIVAIAAIGAFVARSKNAQRMLAMAVGSAIKIPGLRL